jgi:hypothetical protein
MRSQVCKTQVAVFDVADEWRAEPEAEAKGWA